MLQQLYVECLRPLMMKQLSRKKDKELKIVLRHKQLMKQDVMQLNLLLMVRKELSLLMIISHLLLIEQVEKLSLFVKGKLEKMRFGFKSLKKHGLSFAVVMNLLKWGELLNSLKTLMEFLLKCIGQMITKLLNNKKSFSVF